MASFTRNSLLHKQLDKQGRLLSNIPHVNIVGLSSFGVFRQWTSIYVHELIADLKRTDSGDISALFSGSTFYTGTHFVSWSLYLLLIFRKYTVKEHSNFVIGVRLYRYKGKDWGIRYFCSWLRCSSTKRWPFEPVVREQIISWYRASVKSGIATVYLPRFL